MTIRPRRSVLYMPGSNARAIEKAKTLPVDGVILDLEDAVAPDAKIDARKQVAAAVKAGGFGGREVFIRVNGIDSEWHADDLHDAGDHEHDGDEPQNGCHDDSPPESGAGAPCGAGRPTLTGRELSVCPGTYPLPRAPTGTR